MNCSLTSLASSDSSSLRLFSSSRSRPLLLLLRDDFLRELDGDGEAFDDVVMRACRAARRSRCTSFKRARSISR